MNEMDLLKAAGKEIVYSNAYYGKCLLTVWAGKWPRDDEGKIIGRPVRWNDGDPQKEMIVMIDFLLDLIPGCTSNYQVKGSWMQNDRDWQKIVLPSLKEIGAVDKNGDVDLAKIKDHYVKVMQVEGTRPREKGNPDKGNWNTWKFCSVYASAEECSQAMATDTGAPIPSGDTKPAKPAAKKEVSKDTQRRAAALEFCRVALKSMEGMKDEEVKQALGAFIDSNPNIKPYISLDDQEILEMINETAIPFN